MTDQAHDVPLPALVAAIREEADRQGTTISAVALAAGFDDILVRAEAGDAELFVDHVVAIASVLGVSTSALVARAEVLAREAPPQ